MEGEIHTLCPAWFRSNVDLAPLGWLARLGSGRSFPIPAAAHMGTGLPGGFESGFIHPFSGIDHVLAMVSVGLWGRVLRSTLIYVLPVIFPAMMVAGAIMGMFAVPLPPVEVGIALSVLMLGGLHRAVGQSAGCGPRASLSPSCSVSWLCARQGTALGSRSRRL